MKRQTEIIRISILGIIVNILLVIFKGIVGFISGSIAIILDALNNLTDVLSSVITIIGAFLSNKRPNKKHPYGFGRIEYLTSVIIACIVLVAGITSFHESFNKIVKPTTATYSIASFIIIIVAVLTKYFLGHFVKGKGNELKSSSLVASGQDAINDAYISFSTLIGAILSYFCNISIEGYIGLLISLVILKAAFGILKSTIDDMIGVRTDSKITDELKNELKSYKEVQGVSDLIIHNYGPNKIIATAHIQVDDNMTAKEIHRLTRRMTMDIYEETGIIITIGIYASNDKNEYKDILNNIKKIIKDYKNILQLHGFYVDDEKKIISFDIIFSFDELKPEIAVQEIKSKLKELYPKYDFNIIIDSDFSD